MNPFLLPFIFAFSFVFASNGDGPVGPRSAALGHASLTLNDVWSTRHNQGNLGFIRQLEVGTFYENRFFIKELTQTGFAAVLPVKKGTFGFSYSSIGYQLYRQSHTSLGYGLKLSEMVSMGIAIDYVTIKLGDVYGKAQAMTGSFGFTAKLTSQVIVSTHIYNPFRVNMGLNGNEKVPTRFACGARYVFSEKAFMVAEAEKVSGQKLNLKAGIEYIPSSLIFLRVGGCSSPSQAAFGIGINYNGLKIDVSSMYHPILGLSPQIGLSYGFGKPRVNQTLPPSPVNP